MKNIRLSVVCFVYCTIVSAVALGAYPCPYDGPAVNPNESDYQVENYLVELSVTFPADPDEGFIIGSSTAECVSLKDNLQVLNLDFYKDDAAEVSAVTVGGAAASFVFDNDLITVTLATPLNTGDTATVKVNYRAEGLDHFKFLPKPPKTVLYGYNAMVEASRWFPCLHDPRDKALYEFRITTVDSMLSACNGTLMSNIDNGDGTRTMTWIENNPMSTYLATVNVSDYVTFGHDWNGIPVVYYVRADSQADAEIDFQNDDAILDYFDETFGPYPFEKMGLAQVKLAGAMENQDMISYGLITGDMNHEDTFAHEISHMWWGDSVTLTDCRDVWLNEGFASYCEALWNEHFYGDAAYDAVMANFKDRYFNEDANKRFSIYDPEDVWSNTTYRKGAWVLHMLRRVVGDTKFFEILPEYYDRYKFTHAITPEFRQVCEEIYGQPLDWFFQEWIYKAGYPEFTVYSVDHEGDIHLFIEQTQDNAPIFKMPAEFQLDSGAGGSTRHSMTVETGLDHIAIPGNSQTDTVVFDPDSSILSTITYGTNPPAIPRCTIVMPADMYAAGDVFYCQVYVDNYGPVSLDGYPLFALIDVFGQYFFAPSFSEFDHYAETYPSFAPGRTIVDVLPEFTWPEGAGAAEGIIFYAALTDPGMTSLFGEMDMFMFGWE